MYTIKKSIQLKDHLPFALKAARTQVIKRLEIDWSATLGNTAHISLEGCCLHSCSGTSGINEWKYCIASWNFYLRFINGKYVKLNMCEIVANKET